MKIHYNYIFILLQCYIGISSYLRLIKLFQTNRPRITNSRLTVEYMQLY